MKFKIKMMRKILPLLLLLLLFIFLRIFILLMGNPEIGQCEVFRATAAYDFISDRKFELFDYTFRHNEGGSLVVSLMTALFFKIFGVSVFSSHLSPLFISMMSFILGFYLINKYYGSKEAIIFGTVFIFAPQTYVSLSLITWGNHVESILFTFVMIYCLGKIISTEIVPLHREIVFPCLLGLVCGFSIWFAYINMIGVLTCVICIFISDKLFFFRKSFLFFLGFLIIGIAPLFIYNMNYAHGGIGIILYKPFYAHFIDFSLKRFFYKAYSLAIKDFPLSLFFTDGIIFSRKTLAFWNYLGYLVIFFLAIFVKIKSRNFNILKPDYNKKKNLLNVFIFIYLFLFLFIYLISDFSVQHGNSGQGKGYRYIAAILPLFFILFSKAYAYLFNKKYISNSFIYVLIFLNLSGMPEIQSTKNFLKSIKTSPISYQSFGWSIANKFGYNFDKCLAYSQKIELNARNIFFWGLGEEIFNHYINNYEKLNYEFQKLPEYYRSRFYLTLGIGASKNFTNIKNIKKALISIEKIDKRYLKYVYYGLGGEIAMNRFSEISNFSKYINGEYLCFFYTGVGTGVFINTKYDLEKCNYILSNDTQIDEQYRNCCFSGIGLILLTLDEHIPKPKNYYQILKSSVHKINEKYRGYFLQGITENNMLLKEMSRLNDSR